MQKLFVLEDRDPKSKQSLANSAKELVDQWIRDNNDLYRVDSFQLVPNYYWEGQRVSSTVGFGRFVVLLLVEEIDKSVGRDTVHV